jgi:hypothetical protein
MKQDDDLLRLLFGFFPAQVLGVAVKLGIFDQLSAGPRPCADLASAVGAPEPTLRRLLRALECFDLVTAEPDGDHALTSRGRALVSDEPGSAHQLVTLFCSEEMWSAWGALEYSVRTGKPSWEHLFGPAFDYLAERPERNALFKGAQSEGSRRAAAGIVAAADFGRFGTVADIGGGTGALIAAVLAANPAVRGMLVDRPTVVADAPALLETAGVGDRCDVVAGDFFESVPPGADAYVLKNIIHDWDDGRSAEILANCRSAMTDDATLLLVEAIVPEQRSWAGNGYLSVMSDLTMLVCTGGEERTAGEYRALLATAGFDLVGVTACDAPGDFSVLEARPRAGGTQQGRPSMT